MIERIFLGWDRPALVAAAEHLAGRATHDGELDLGDAVVVLSGARAGRRLTELLLDAAAARGARLVPPRILTVRSLPEVLVEPSLPPASPVVRRRLWVQALRAVDAVRLATVFPEAPAPDDLLGWSALAAEVERLHEELTGAGWRFADVAARFGGASGSVAPGSGVASPPPGTYGAAPSIVPFLYDDRSRWEVLTEVQQAYEAGLARIRRSDPGLTCLDAAAAGAVVVGSEIWLTAVAEMPPVVRRLLRAATALGANVHALVHAPAERAEDFDDDGCLLPDAWADADVPLADAQIEVRDRPADQADAVVNIVAGLEQPVSPDQITVGVPDAELVPILERRLQAARLPVRYAAGRPLPRTAPYRLLESVAAYLDAGDFETFAALIRHPDVTDWLGRRVSSAGASASPETFIEAADRYFSEHLPLRVDPILPNGRGAPELRTILDALDGPAPDALLAGLRARRTRPLSEWAAPVLDLLVEVYGARTLVRDRPADRAVVEACVALRDAAGGYHGLGAEVDEPCDAATAIRLILDDAAAAAVPPSADRSEIELLGWLELHLDDAPVKIVTGFNEPYVPESVHGDAFLPDTLRSALGLTENRMRRARDGYYLTAMLHSTPTLRVVAGRRDVRGDPLRPSRLMLARRGAALAERVRRYYRDSAGPPPSAAPAVPGAQVGAETPARGAEPLAAGAALAGTEPATGNGSRTPASDPFRLPPEPVIRVTEPIDSLAVTDFRTLLTDPYLFALERLRKLEALDDEARELDAAGFGSLAHDVLQRFGELPEINRPDPEAAAKALDRLLDDVARRRFGSSPLPAVRVQLEQLRSRLRAFAEWHAGWIAGGWRVVAVEGRALGAASNAGAGGTEPVLGVEIDVDGAPFTIRGRIDRVDHNVETGEWAVFDYKTSELGEKPEKTHVRSGKWVDLQLPLYRYLVRAITGPDGTPLVPPDAWDRVRVGYILLPRELERVGAALAGWSPEEFASADEAARDVVRLVRTGEFAYSAEAAARYRGPLASLLGVGQLVGASSSSDDADAETEEGP